VNKKTLLSALLSLSFSLLTLPAYAQIHRGLIRGRLTDASGAAIAGAKLKVVRTATGETREATSDASGEYAVTLLPAGGYRLQIDKPGFRHYVVDLTLEVNHELRFDLQMQIAGLEVTEDVNAPPARVERDSNALGEVIENRQITGLPLDGRNFLELSLLVAGAAPAAPGSAGSVRGDFAFNVNGAREDSNNFLLDGVYNVDPKLNTFGVRPPVDAVQEFAIITSGYDASFGRNAGAQVNVILKSGTNSFHGTAYEFFRNAALDARNFFAPANEPAPKYQRNQFGFSLGGPIVKDRTFFFADYEGLREREGITRVTNVPTALERAGDFSQSFLPAPINPFTRQPFADRKIPAQLLNPIGARVAALYPLPNRSTPFQNFVSSPTRRDRNDHFDVRLDHVIAKSSSLAARYSFGDRDLYEPFSGPNFAAVPGFGTNIPRRAQNAMIAETHVFSPSLLNEARFAYNRVAAGSFHENLGRSINQSVGLPEVSRNQRDFGLSFISIIGFSPLGDEYNNPQHSTTNTYQFLDTATYTRGSHLVKFGFEFRANQQNGYRDVQSRGFLNFVGLFTGNPLADLLIGLPIVTGSARVDNHQHLRTTSYNLFVNDGWRVTPRLTLNAGLRYEYNTPAVDADDRANVYDPATKSLVRVGTSGIPRSGYEADKNNFAPRVGFAWTLDKEQQTVLRAGYGFFYDQSALAPGEALFFNAPYYDFVFNFPSEQSLLTLFNPFPNTLAAVLPRSALAFQRDLRTPYMQHWNANVQRQLGASRVLEVAYVGSKGTKLLTARDINQPRPGPRLPAPFPPYLRPVPQFEDITMLESRANSHYHSLQMTFQQRLAEGLSLLSAYTWAKSIDDASGFFSSAGDPNFPQDSYNVSAERGRSNFDVRHRFSLSYLYELPFGRGRRWIGNAGWVSAVLGGWQSAGIVTLQTGRPFTVALLTEEDNSNTGRANLGFGANDRPNLVGDAKLSNPTPERWFNTTAFVKPPFGSFGNAGRNILDGPGYANVNFSLLKDVGLTEGLKLQLRAESFNLFNRPNFDLPDNFLGSPSFGRIRSAQSPRRIQFGVKLLF
jgi:hypothetical protein